jgi:hypothetical protein
MARRSSAALAVGLLVLAAPGCGGGGGTPARTVPQPHAQHVRNVGELTVERLTYAAPGGRRSAVLVTPRAFAPRGCLMWQNGLGPRDDDAARIWHRAARLGLAVFTVELPDDGLGDAGAADAGRLAALVPTWLADLRRAADLLHQRPACRGTVGYAGVGLGGMLGSVLAGRDDHVRVAVLAAAAPTWRSVMASPDAAAQRALAPLDPERWLPRIAPRPALLLVGRHDRAAARTIAAAPSPKHVVRYAGGDPFARTGDAGPVFAVEQFLLTWLVKPGYE